MYEKLNPIHPGEVLLEEFLKPMNLSQNRLAIDIGVDARRINEIVLGVRRKSANTALRLSRYFDVSPQFWLGLQEQYNIDITLDSLGDRLDHVVRPESKRRFHKRGSNKKYHTTKRVPDQKKGVLSVLHHKLPRKEANKSRDQIRPCVSRSGRSKIMMEYKDHNGKVELDDQAGILYGEVINIRDVVTFEGTSVDEVQKAFHESVDDNLAFCAQRGDSSEKPFSGLFVMRLPTELHQPIFRQNWQIGALMVGLPKF